MAERNEGPPRTPTIEDLVLLESTVESLRQERDQLLRRLQTADSSARERLQLMESRYREAASQVEALKRAGQQIREQLEEQLSQAHAHLRTASESAQQWQATAEALRQRATELEGLLESAHSRVADLETENAVLQAEVERLQALVDEMQPELERLRTALTHAEEMRVLSAQEAENTRRTLLDLSEQYASIERRLEEAVALADERARQNQLLSSALEQAEHRIRELATETAELRTALDSLAAEYAGARHSWELELARKSEEWTQTRDTLARALEDEQNRSAALERESGQLRAQLCSLQMRSQLEAEQVARLEEEVQAARAELERERGIFEELRRQRDDEWQRKLADLDQAFASYREDSEATIAALRSQLESVQAASESAAMELGRLRQELEAVMAARAQLEERAAQLGQEADTLRAACQERERACAVAEARVADLEQELDALRAELRARTTALEQQRAELDRQQQRIDSLSNTWARERSEWTRTVEDLQLHRDQLETELQQACWQLQELDARLQRATVDYHAASLAAARAQAEWARWELTYRLQARSYEALEQRSQNATASATSRAARLAAVLQDLDRERTELREQLNIRARELEARTQQEHELRSQCKTLDEQRRALQEEVVRLQQAWEEAKAYAARLTQQLDERSQAEAHLVAEYERRLLEKEQALASLQQERERLAGELEHLRIVLAELERTASSSAQKEAEELAQLREQVAQWRERASTAEASLQDLEEKLRASREDLHAGQLELERSQAEHRLLQDRIDTLSARLEEQTAAYREAQKELEETQRHLATLQEQSVAILQAQEILTQENQSLRDELERAQLDRQRLAQACEQALREREEAVRHWQDSEALRQKEQATYLSIRQQLDSERENLRTALEAARSQQAQLQAQITLLQRERGGKGALPSAEILELERERAELKAQVEKLSAVIRQLGQEREEQRVAALQTQATLTARIDEIAAERGALTLRVAELETLVSQLDRECERLRKERLSPEEMRKYKAEVARLEARVEELERLRAEAAQNHSAVVAGYLLELNQRTEALQAKEGELQALQRELRDLQATIEELQSRLEAEQEERTQLEAALEELRRAAAGGALRTASKSPEPSARPKISQGKESAPLKFAESPAPYTRPGAAGGVQAPLAGLRDAPGLTVVHLEENKECREHVQRLLKQIPSARYLNTLELADTSKDGPILLAVNLLNRAHDPIAALTRIVRQGGNYGIFAYCSAGNFGFLFGEATFFPSPFDIDACATWLMSQYGSIQRLLVASNNIEMTSELRTQLAKVRCSVSVALDFRQVIELIPLIQPEIVLVDLSLPRADGLRLISRLRNDEKTAALPIGVILPDHHRVAELRHNAARAARDGSLSVETLIKVLAQELGLPAADIQNEAPTAQPSSP